MESVPGEQLVRELGAQSRKRRKGRGLDPALVAAAGRQPRAKRPPLVPESPGKGPEGGNSAGDCRPDQPKEEWTPQAFLDAALDVRHPFDDPYEPPSGLREAMKWWATRSPEDARREVHQIFRSGRSERSS